MRSEEGTKMENNQISLFAPNSPSMLAEAAQGRQTKKWWLQLIIFLAVYLIAVQGVGVILGMGAAVMYIFSKLSVMSLEEMQALSPEQITSEMMSGDKFSVMMLWSEALTIVLLLIFVRFIEKRSLRSAGYMKKNWLGKWLLGGLAGAGMFSLAVGICAAFGSVRFNGFTLGGKYGLLALYFAGFAIQSMCEELLCRGYLMTSWGSKGSLTAAVIVSSVVFGLLHLGNPNFTLLAFFNIVLFGFIMALAMLRTNSIWSAAGLHALWNFAQGNIFGISVSGMEKMTSVFSFNTVGKLDLVTGGAFGIEGGLACTAVEIIAIVLLLVWKGERQAEQTASGQM